MTLIYTNQKSKLSKKQRMARETLLKEQRAIKRSMKPTKTITQTVHRQTPHYPSLNSNNGTATIAINSKKVYTGENLLGVAVMHKSNLVPVFSQEAAVEISKMRRG